MSDPTLYVLEYRDDDDMIIEYEPLTSFKSAMVSMFKTILTEIAEDPEEDELDVQLVVFKHDNNSFTEDYVIDKEALYSYLDDKDEDFVNDLSKLVNQDADLSEDVLDYFKDAEKFRRGNDDTSEGEWSDVSC